jgi:glutaredoxin
VLTLYQAEWCPHSHRVRQALTERGVDFIAKQVPAEPEDREDMRRETGHDSIPVLVLEDGRPSTRKRRTASRRRSITTRRDRAH